MSECGRGESAPTSESLEARARNLRGETEASLKVHHDLFFPFVCIGYVVLPVTFPKQAKVDLTSERMRPLSDHETVLRSVQLSLG